MKSREFKLWVTVAALLMLVFQHMAAREVGMELSPWYYLAVIWTSFGLLSEVLLHELFGRPQNAADWFIWVLTYLMGPIGFLGIAVVGAIEFLTGDL